MFFYHISVTFWVDGLLFCCFVTTNIITNDYTPKRFFVSRKSLNLGYIKDAGLQGHPQDIEYIFIFVPEKNDNCGVIVGAGHGDQIPNNVLEYNKKEIPDSLGSHIPVLVEWGGHSNAPDINDNGRFDPGIDVNWQTSDAWGTRDIQAGSGSGAVGNYELWMTFQRNHTHLKVFPPDDSIKGNKIRYQLVPVKWLKSVYDTLALNESASVMV